MILPLTPFEEYLVHEDRPGFPCWNVARFSCAGRFDVERLETAWQQTATAQPMLRARLISRLLRGPAWRIEPDSSVPPVVVVSALGPHGWPSRWLRLDLASGPGARLYLHQQDNRAVLFAQFHHALVDGLGLGAIMEELFARYATLHGASVKLPSRDPALLRARGSSGLPWLERIRGLPMQLVGLLGASQLLLGREASPLLPHTLLPADSPPVAFYPAVESRVLDPDAFGQLRNAAKKARVSVNEMLMRDLQAAIGAWRGKQAPDAPQDWMRLAVPVLIRSAVDRRMPACNLVSLVIIDRTVKSCRNRARLLRRAREDMEMILKHRLGLVFWRILKLCRWLPGGLAAYSLRPKVRATCVMTNFGRIFHQGPVPHPQRRYAVPGAVLENVVTAPVIRPGTIVCLGLSVMDMQLHADLHYDSRVLTQAQAAALADEFVRQTELSVRGE